MAAPSGSRGAIGGSCYIQKGDLRITPSPRLQVSGLVQVDPSRHTLTSNARLRWECIRGTEPFVVYSDGRTSVGVGYADLPHRTLAVKIARLFQFKVRPARAPSASAVPVSAGC
jgi:hypothetical protein